MDNLEPVALINSGIGVIEAAVALAVGFGLELSAEQVGLVMALVVGIGNLAKTIWSRSQVTPIANPRIKEGDVAKPLVVQL
ncbi:MAG: hypothetical protein GY937_20580 [bacterium]|nr:hypothetical protein [bacterium]